ncbi:MAG: S-methyl-5-thioribose-1-phosphate isomerase [Candidatus Glassbacteria bacterium]
MIKSIEYNGNAVRIIDQTKLPERLEYRDLKTAEQMFEAIRSLRVRGAPAIGIAGAMGVWLGVSGKEYSDEEELFEELEETASLLSSARPTAYNLFWAIERVKVKAYEHRGNGPTSILGAIRAETEVILEDEREMSRLIGKNALPYIKDQAVVLTHCNTGILATGGKGTALAGIYAAKEAGRKVKIFSCETRPLLQGARLTTWELMQEGLDVTLITDNMAAHVMQSKGVDLVILGADRIARNGDAANKIGTYQHALCARAHRIPFYVAAPISTIDLSTARGEDIKIEERDHLEVVEIKGQRIAPAGVEVYNPAFDVTPAELITAIITDRGVIERPNEKKVLELCGQPKSIDNN